MLVSLFSFILLSAALIRIILLQPLPLAAGLMAGHAALVVGAGPVGTFSAFALAVAGAFATMGLLTETPWRVVRWPGNAIKAAASLIVMVGLIDAAKDVIG